MSRGAGVSLQGVKSLSRGRMLDYGTMVSQIQQMVTSREHTRPTAIKRPKRTVGREAAVWPLPFGVAAAVHRQWARGTAQEGGRRRPRVPAAVRLHRQHLPLTLRRDPDAPSPRRAAGRTGGRSLHLSSAGVQAVVGGPIHPDSRAQLAPWGLHRARRGGFAARQLDPAIATSAHLVLGVSPEHRSAVVGCAPAALATAFSLAEFARLVDSVDRTGCRSTRWPEPTPSSRKPG